MKICSIHICALCSDGKTARNSTIELTKYETCTQDSSEKFSFQVCCCSSTAVLRRPTPQYGCKSNLLEVNVHMYRYFFWKGTELRIQSHFSYKKQD